MDDAIRIGLSGICTEYVRLVGKPAPTSSAQLRTWLVDGLLTDLVPERNYRGRWTVQRDRIPLLEQIAPRLVARSCARMRHEHLRGVVAEVAA
jgi:hypothetical protein